MEKQDILSFFYNTSREFPMNKISEDSLKHREFIFSESPQEPASITYYDMSQSFVNEIREKNNNRFIKRNKAERNNAKPGNLTNTRNDDTLAFLVTGAVNKSEVQDFVKGSKNVPINQEKQVERKVEKLREAFDSMNGRDEKSQSIIDTHVVIGDISAEDINDKRYQEFFKSNDDNTTQTREAVKFPPLENFQPTLNVNNTFTNIPGNNLPLNPNQIQNKVMIIPAFNPMYMPIPTQSIQFEPVKIENIYMFNQKVNISNELPLWYLHYPMPQQPMTGIGPISSKRLHEMYNVNQVNSQTNFRPIDIFKFSFSNLNEFAKIKLINDEDWVSKIEDSPLLQYTELYSRSHKIFSSEIIKNQTVENEKIKKIKIEEETIQKKQEVINIKNHPEVRPSPKDKIEIVTNAPHTVKKQNIINVDETLNFTQPLVKNEFKDFVADTILDDPILISSQENEKTLFLNVDGGIKKEIELDSGEWEVVKKTKKKPKAQDESVYLIGNKPKENLKKENKFNCKIELIPSEDLVNQLKPKQKPKEVKPDFEAFNSIGNSNANYDKNQQFQEVNKKKKNKGKPQELNVKLGFKI